MVEVFTVGGSKANTLHNILNWKILEEEEDEERHRSLYLPFW
jgi:hypothetical protein